MIENEYAYYSGCSLEGTAASYNTSVKVILEALGLSYREPPDWSCCGSTPAHSVDHLLAAALAARNLAIVEKMGLSVLTTPCPSCLSAFKKAQSRIAKSSGFKGEVNGLLDQPYEGTVNSKSTLQIIYEDVGLEALSAKVKFSMPDLKVACYYGCILSRPPDIAQFDDPENPISMDRILSAVGVQVCDFAFKVECCGAAFGVVKKEMVNRLTAKVLAMALDVGANCVAVACPLCQQNLDLRQGQVNATTGSSFNIPILYFTQIMGLAYGYSPAQLDIGKHIVSPAGLIRTVPFDREKAEDDKKGPKRNKVAKADKAAATETEEA